MEQADIERIRFGRRVVLREIVRDGALLETLAVQSDPKLWQLHALAALVVEDVHTLNLG